MLSSADRTVSLLDTWEVSGMQKEMLAIAVLSCIAKPAAAACLHGVEPHVVGCHIFLLSPRNDAERIVGQRAL
jgi:hypothetical protein